MSVKRDNRRFYVVYDNTPEHLPIFINDNIVGICSKIRGDPQSLINSFCVERKRCRKNNIMIDTLTVRYKGYEISMMNANHL